MQDVQLVDEVFVEVVHRNNCTDTTVCLRLPSPPRVEAAVNERGVDCPFNHVHVYERTGEVLRLGRTPNRTLTLTLFAWPSIPWILLTIIFSSMRTSDAASP